MFTGPAFRTRASRMSYTDLFALGLRYGLTGLPLNLSPGHARRSSLSSENPHPLRQNVLYLHVPFCASRCRYCPYYSHPHSPSLMRTYVEALARETVMVSETPYARSTRFWCVYFGGGTPSLLPPNDLAQLADLIHRRFNLTADVEITFEANPSTLTGTLLHRLRALGFNRVSLGVQSFQDSVLRTLRCAHSAALARHAMHDVLEQGLMLNVDLLFGLIGQSQADLDFDLAQLCADRHPHQVTLFPLRLASGTPLANDLQRRGALDVMDHHHRLLQFDARVEQYLHAHAYTRAEAPISYYQAHAGPHRYQSLEGRIVGLGAGAGSVLEAAESVNHRDVVRYIRDLGENRFPVAHDVQTTRDQARERHVLFRILFLNRSLAGFRDVVARRFSESYDEPLGDYYERVVQDLRRRGYVEPADDRLVFTERLWTLLGGLEIGTPSIL
jgi:oxygen-independent coproporphyrinogen-3 oxidase